jgi:hypothetical protein
MSVETAMPEVTVFISQEVQFFLPQDEWIECSGRIVVQVHVTISPQFDRSSITTWAILPTETEKYKRGDIGPRGYKNVSLPEDVQAQYIAQAHAAIKAELKRIQKKS